MTGTVVGALDAPRRRDGSGLAGPALGIGWRPEVAGVAADRVDVGFVEVVAESIHDDDPLPLGLALLLERSIPVLTHGIGLSLGGAERPDRERLAALARVAARLRSPIVSEHLAFVRAGGRSAGHLLAVPRTRRAVRVLAENIRIAQDHLPVPLAVESPASFVDWPEDELDEADFVTEVVERSGALLLLDLANLYVNARNRAHDPRAVLDRLPLERLAYVHVAGGHVRSGIYHDTHAAPVWREVLDLVRDLVARVPDARVMLERDDSFGTDAELDHELDAIASALRAPVAATSSPSGPSSRVPHMVAALSGAPEGDAGLDGDRAALERGQRTLLRALVDDGAVPPGFDLDRVATLRAALLAKRTREVAQRWPATAACLGDDFAVRFRAYARGRPPPPAGGPTADGAGFVAGLGRGAGDASARDEWRRGGLATPRGRRRW